MSAFVYMLAHEKEMSGQPSISLRDLNAPDFEKEFDEWKEQLAVAKRGVVGIVMSRNTSYIYAIVEDLRD